MSIEIDPVRYEVFRHRLFNILEEGRIAIGMISGSPVVVEGGETMCSFHLADGRPILVAAGILLHAYGARDFIMNCVEMYEKNPGINDGDQFFFNDPYIGGQHAADMVVIKPIFYQGMRVAWTGAIMHTPETGSSTPTGQDPGYTNVYQEGIKILGLKVVEAGRFRP
ncbi:hydantoinase B/oxoprolinase family protein, partial [Chloroflexota bacterium]